MTDDGQPCALTFMDLLKKGCSKRHNMTAATDLLDTDLQTLPISDELKAAAARNNISRLRQLTALHMNEILELPGFDHRTWNEYVELLENNHLGYLLNKKSPPR